MGRANVLRARARGPCLRQAQTVLSAVCVRAQSPGPAARPLLLDLRTSARHSAPTRQPRDEVRYQPSPSPSPALKADSLRNRPRPRAKLVPVG
jgi:hypothetical protein